METRMHYAWLDLRRPFMHNALSAARRHCQLHFSGDRHVKGQPLAGIRVLEVGAYISAPYASVILAALGAEVVKVEPPEGEAFRRGEDNRNAYFIQYNTGKKSVAINLKSKTGAGLVK